ncbi:MAG: ABC transporter permease [Gammaproteobacteria bacterium WSBS_2016_MAG_OTU1]
MIDNIILILQKYGHVYLEGLGMTVQLTLLSLIVGFILSWPLAVALHTKRRVICLAARGFVYYTTGTPLLVQLFLVYFGLGQFEAIRESFLWIALREPYWCALLAFSFNTAGYSAQIFGGAMQNTNRGEIEAARAYGMSEWQLLSRIVAPSAFRRAIPAYGNEIIFLMHGSSLASVVTLLDLTGAARVAARGTFAFSESYLVAIILYMSLTGILVALFRFTEHRLLAHLRPVTTT